MATRPPGITYHVDEKPPLFVNIILGLQHIFTMSSMLILPVIIVQEIGGTDLEAKSMVSFSMIAAGLGTILQALKKGPVGSGYLCPNLCGPSYMSVTLEAGWLGGLPLIHGMIIFGGFVECLFSRFVHRLKKLFPPEITGLVVFMVGVGLIPLGASKFIGVEYPGERIDPIKLIVSFLTLMMMIGFNLWGRGKLKLYSVLIGIIGGFILSMAFGLITSADSRLFSETPLFSLPGKGVKLFRYSFDAGLILPFALVSLAQSLKTFGNLTTCQKINDADWKDVDVKNIGKGLMADGLSVFLGGFLGGVATDSSASNVGLSAATGATSRYIAWSAGIIFMLFGFMPKLAAVFTIMPQPVMGAIILFVTSFMLLSGIQIILTRPVSTQKIFIIGISMIIGLSVDIIPSLYSSIPSWLAPLFSSSLTVSTVLAVVLNLLFNIGSKTEK